MRTFSASWVAVAVGLLVGPAIPHADDARPTNCIEMKSAFSAEGADGGGYSLTTGEQIAESAFLVAQVEGANADAHPAFEDQPQAVLIVRTVGGRHVLRILGPQPDARLH